MNKTAAGIGIAVTGSDAWCTGALAERGYWGCATVLGALLVFLLALTIIDYAKERM